MDGRRRLVGQILSGLSPEKREALAYDKLETFSLGIMRGAALMLDSLDESEEDRVRKLARFMRDLWGDDAIVFAPYLLERTDDYLTKPTHVSESSMMKAEKLVRAAFNELMR